MQDRRLIAPYRPQRQGAERRQQEVVQGMAVCAGRRRFAAHCHVLPHVPLTYLR